MKTFPETTTFKWEHAVLEYSHAISIMRDAIKQGGSVPRRAAYRRAVELVEACDHDDIGGTTISGRELKRLLTQAAQEVGWSAPDRKANRTPRDRAPEGFKTCFVCREVKPVDEFMTTPTAAQVQMYGWRPDTKRRIPTHVCSDCRKKRADALRLKRSKRAPRIEALLKGVDNPEQAERIQRYKRLLAQMGKHQNRTAVRISTAKQEVVCSDGTKGFVYEFRDDSVRDYYFMRRDLLDIAKHRLNAMLGETTPIPMRWALLLTKEERAELETLHEQAFVNAKKKPDLW